MPSGELFLPPIQKIHNTTSAPRNPTPPTTHARIVSEGVQQSTNRSETFLSLEHESTARVKEAGSPSRAPAYVQDRAVSQDEGALERTALRLFQATMPKFETSEEGLTRW